MSVPLTKATVLKKLESIYWCALKDGNWHAALRAVELQGKAVGLFEKQLLPKVVRIADMTEGQLTEFIDRLEERDSTLEPLKESPLPKNKPDGQNTAFESLIYQGAAPTEGEHGNLNEPLNLASTTRHGISEGKEAPLGEPVDNSYLGGKNPAGKYVLPHLYPEWEKPPPFAYTTL